MSRMGRREMSLLTLLGDLVALAVAFEGAVRLRLALNPLFRARIDPWLMAELVPPLGLVLLLWVMVSVWLGLYRRRPGPFLRSAVPQVAAAMLLAVVLTIVVIFFVRDFNQNLSRSFVLLLFMLGTAAMLAVRCVVWGLARLADPDADGIERVLLVGRGRGVRSLIARLERGGPRALRLCGVVTPAPGEGAGTLGNPVPVVGALAELPALINRHGVERVIAVEGEVPSEQMRACVSICTRMGVTLNRTAESLEAESASLGVAEIGDTLLIEVRGFEFTRAQQAVKRAFDLASAGALLIALSPLLLALSALIKMTSKGRVLYVAPRVGRGGRHFPFYKFRSMVADAEAHRPALAARNEKRGHLFKVRSDPRVTPIGRFMRRFSLDELPQLLNVLRGDMSLVGPRPLPVRDLEPDGLSREYRFWAKDRCKVLPGLTGLWQVRGRSNLGFDDMLRLDVSYVRNWNLWLDVRILLQTVPAVLRGRGAC